MSFKETREFTVNVSKKNIIESKIRGQICYITSEAHGRRESYDKEYHLPQRYTVYKG